MTFLVASAASLILAAAAGPAPAPRPAYAEGQVWEYRTRKGDEGSRLRIQKIEPFPGLGEGGRVYHIAVVGVNLGPGLAGAISHLPVSRESLDMSVTRLSSGRADFGDPKEGLEQWRRAEGGVFTLAVARIVELIADTAATGTPPGD